MNRFKKYCPNVFVAACEKEHEKGDIIQVTTKYDKEVECEIFNFLGADKNSGNFYYSIVKIEDKSYAERRAERFQNAAEKNSQKSDNYWEQSQEGKEFLTLAEPIKNGHYSEKWHRGLIERNTKRMDKCVEFSKKAEAQKEKASYWARKAEEITLAMPESLKYFIEELAKATEYHLGVKSGKYPKGHDYTLTYAKKRVNELTKKVEIATKLWG